MKTTDETPGEGRNCRILSLVLIVALPGMISVSAREVNHQTMDQAETQQLPFPDEKSQQNNDSRYVRIIYLYPADSIEKPAYTLALENAIRHLRIWYFEKLERGITFALHDPVVEVYQTPHEAHWYATNSNGAPFYWFWNNVVEDGFALTGGTQDDDDNIWVFYMDANPACGQCGGCGGNGTVVISANDLKGLVGDEIDKTCPEIVYSYEPCRYVGGMGHEIGHALGVPHPPECDEEFPDCWDHDLMMYGYIAYPEAFLNEASKNILNNNRFIEEVDLEGFTFPCSCMNLTDWSIICSGTQQTISCGDSILLAGAYQYATGIYRDTLHVETGCDTILVTYLKVEVPPPEVENNSVSICEGEKTPDFVAAGENVTWFADADLTDLIYEGDTLRTKEAAAGTYHYYVTQTYDGCTSPSVQVTLAIISLPDVPISRDTACCEGESIDHITVDSHYGLIKWYSDPELTNLLSDSERLNLSDITEPGTYTFYVTRTMECESLPGKFTFTVNPSPEKPALVDQSICEDKSSAILFAAGQHITWYGESGSDMFDSRDRQVYKGVEIGNQIWMAENLNYYTLNGSRYYDDDSLSFSRIYGRLYDFQVAHEVCPTGWHLPSLSEWNEMIYFLGGDSVAGGKLKAVDTTYWAAPNMGATNEAGFGALPGGCYVFDSFLNMGGEAIFWTNTGIWEMGRAFKLSSGSPYITEERLYMEEEGASIRCIKDSLRESIDIIEFGDTLVISNIQAGTLPFYATQTIANCESPLDTVILQIFTSPGIDLGNDTTMTIDQEITLDAGFPGYVYTWNDGSDLPLFKITGSEVGPGEHMYWVAVTDPNLCTGSDSITITVIDPTKTDCTKGRHPITIYPNPLHDIVIIQTKGTGAYSIEVTSMKGRIIHHGRFTDGSYQIDFSPFPEGVYIITVTSDDFLTTRKVIKL